MKTQEILTVAETPAGIHLLFITFDDADTASALGHVYRVSFDNHDTAEPLQLLATNDTLRAMWASPAGHLWVASADGFVGTTAPVNWPAAPGVDYQALNGSDPWHATALPRRPHDGLPPNVTALWGTGDDDVFAAAYGGHIYRWDGAAWSLVHDAGPSGRTSVSAFGGTGPRDVYAAGQARTLLHWDGQAFSPVQVPGTPANETLSGVVALPDGSVLVAGSGNAGRILHGTAAGGFTELCTTPHALVGMVGVAGRVFLALPHGAAELVGHQVQVLRDTFQTASVSGGRRRVFFIEPAQESPRYIQHDLDADDRPWWRFAF